MSAPIAENDSHSNSSYVCRCVIFRMDDVQDNFIDVAQTAAMNLFITKNQSLALGLIMHDIGRDAKVVGKVGEGIQLGLFELALHGWQHVDYSTLAESVQKATLNDANEKMGRLYGNKSNIFIPPYGTFNYSTLKAMRELGIKVLSAALFSEKNLDNGTSVLNLTSSGSRKGQWPIMQNGNSITSTTTTNATSGLETAKADTRSKVLHIPAMTFFKDKESNKKPIKVPISKMLEDVHTALKRYGYAVVVFHPQDFFRTDINGKIVNGTLDLGEINDLSSLIDELLHEKILITSFSHVAGIEPEKYSYFR